VEAPLEIRLHGRPAAVLMRTPGGEVEDRELVTGFLFCEGVIDAAREVLAVERVDDAPQDGMGGTVVDVRLETPSRGRGIERFFYSTSSCGACGKRSIESLAVKGVSGAADWTVRPEQITGMLAHARKDQSLFARTGGVHASGLFSLDGELALLREDVGRHNALDKVIGASLLGGAMPLDQNILAISGRVGYEIIQKAAVAGIPFIAAVGAPTSLAVDLAWEHGITLVGFAKPGGMNVYSHPGRVCES
jgi:FdhD protein